MMVSPHDLDGCTRTSCGGFHGKDAALGTVGAALGTVGAVRWVMAERRMDGGATGGDGGEASMAR